jgi:uncharacterized membrane protein
VASPSWATPVGIVALESTILFSLVRTTGGTAALRPLLSGALAVNMDAILDPIAVPVLWHWQVSGPWFGIPLSNYSAWFLSVAAFSAGLQIAPPLTGIGAAAIAFGVCAGCFLMSFLIYKFSALAALLFVSALPLLRARRQPTRTARSPLVAVFALCLIVMVLTRAGGRYWLVWAITASIQALYFWRMARLRDESSHPQPSRTRSKAFTA